MQIKSTAVLLNYTDTHVHVHTHQHACALTLAAMVNYQVVEDNVRFNGLIGLFFVSVTHQRAETSVAGQTQARSHTETHSVLQIFVSVLIIQWLVSGRKAVFVLETIHWNWKKTKSMFAHTCRTCATTCVCKVVNPPLRSQPVSSGWWVAPGQKLVEKLQGPRALQCVYHSNWQL